GGIASFTFPAPLPAGAVTGDLLTTTGFTPAVYNLTNAIIASADTATGVITVALGQLGSATAATWAGGVASFTFPVPLPAGAVTGDLLTTTGFTPAGYNVTSVAITSVSTTTGVITVALAANPGASTVLGTGTANLAASTVRGTGTATVAYTYSEVVKNNTSSATVTSGTITVYMQTPANTVYETYNGTDWNCTNPGAGAAGPIVCTYNAALASGATASTLNIAFEVTAGTAAGTTILNSATVTNSTFVDPIPSNNTNITSIIVEPTTTSDLSVSESVSPTPVFVSSNLTYTIIVQNLGQLAAPVTTGVLTDTLPSGVTYVSSSASAGWSCSGTTTISCNITAAMNMGSTATITITVTAPSSATTLTNTATVSLAGDPNSSNNFATAYTVVQPLVCATPGKDGAVGALTGIVNAYYPPSTTGTLAAGSKSVR